MTEKVLRFDRPLVVAAASPQVLYNRFAAAGSLRSPPERGKALMSHLSMYHSAELDADIGQPTKRKASYWAG